jgi:membrane protein insertase Oxa1/YidC/SpoIIIJ
VLYWFISNVLGLVQQQIINRTLPPVEPFVPKTSVDGSVIASGEVSPPGPLAANPKLVSPKNKRKK